MGTQDNPSVRNRTCVCRRTSTEPDIRLQATELLWREVVARWCGRREGNAGKGRGYLCGATAGLYIVQ